jgi:hypothetical protein
LTRADTWAFAVPTTASDSAKPQSNGEATHYAHLKLVSRERMWIRKRGQATIVWRDPDHGKFN